jgi:hypothetical protein
MTARLTRLDSRRRSFLLRRDTVVRRVGSSIRAMPVLVRSRPVMMLRVIVVGVVVDVERRHRRGGGHQSGNEQGGERPSHSRESTQRDRAQSNQCQNWSRPLSGIMQVG